jgi:alkylation response protein AidB-like acyl-CoA dehydrogenase
MAVVSGSILTETLVQACRQRAAAYDRDNKFCQEDFDELKAAGYLKLAVPREFGGLGMKLADVGRETRRLATYAAPTALCINMHNYWVGTAADVWRSGDKSVQWILEEAGAGEVFAAGHAESGNETSIVMSITKAERVAGGYRFTGRKSFGSLSPVWTRLGMHGMDTSDPSSPKVVHAFMPRDTKGYAIKETWDVMACARRAATTRSSTARSCPTSTSRASSPPVSPARICSCCRSSRGR